MDDLLVGAAILCTCKLTCTFPFLPSLYDCNSPVSFCCCCLLVLTDLLVTVFLALLHMFDYWVTDLSPVSDAIALRFLLFLSHTYGAALPLTIPLIAADILTAQLCSHRDGEGGEEEEEQEEEEDSNNDTLTRAVGYFCCLSVWVAVASVVWWRWMLQEDITAACLLTTNSFLRCLPNLISPVYPCWGMLFFSLLGLLLSTVLYVGRRRPAHMEEKQPRKRRINKSGDSCRENLVQSAPSVPVNYGMPLSVSAQRVDPEKTESSCIVNGTYSRNSLQMSTHHPGDFVLISYKGQLGWRHWGFPCMWLNVMIVLVFVLCMFVLPLILSVNIVTVRCIETLLEVYFRYVVQSAAHAAAFHKVTPV
ncbi:hypothetical protein JOB18_004517 [Solea senegalensis]|nr:hypothetical protein JOB18_004517 [Solea senegalensis]KAG7493255.1 hypothetical protein JOB18_004517 [Solea senegalensis]